MVTFFAGLVSRCSVDHAGPMIDDDTFEVVVSAGSLRGLRGVTMPHRWTTEGVVVEAEFTGAHLYHLAAAGCVLNDVYREAVRLGTVINGVRVSARGGFDTPTWVSTGVTYDVELDSDSSEAEVARLLGVVDEVAEIPRALRSATTVERLATTGGFGDATGAEGPSRTLH